ncbi:hypothetical protein ACH5RR_008665 [Cinchona calisaya]|uniref:Bifunctional inhibitor/plant lipid transfer protein/seed storage helical domain-containing protein n=1 Tax=Cinchona calisaya TaxID=153742 RepID=A0ABD3ADW8_9GENT
MAASRFILLNATISLVLLFIIASFLPNANSQSQAIGNSHAGPSVDECVPHLLPLAPCGSFVQGTSPAPGQTCCDNVRQLYGQELSCLCLMVNDPSMSSFPINRTLALQLPVLCNLQGGLSTCSAGGVAVPFPPSSPTSQVSFGRKTNATVAASPLVTVSPRTSIMGLVPHNGAKLNPVYHIVVALIAEIIFFGIKYIFESWGMVFLTF